MLESTSSRYRRNRACRGRVQTSLARGVAIQEKPFLSFTEGRTSATEARHGDGEGRLGESEARYRKSD